MLKCHSCKKGFNYPVQLTVHQSFECKSINNGDERKYQCAFEHCQRHFTSARFLQRHINRIHLRSPSSTSENGGPSNDDSASLPMIVEDSVSEVDSSVQDSAQKSLSEVISQLYGHPMVPLDVVQFTVDSFTPWISADHVMRAVAPRTGLLDADIESALHNIVPRHLRHCLSSERMRLKYFESLGTFIRPREIALGHEYGSSGSPRTIQVIPLSRVLAKFFNRESVTSDLLFHMNSLPITVDVHTPLTNFIQGSAWRGNWARIIRDNAPNELSLPMTIFCDEIEIGDPLGSKLCGVYVSFPCLPPKYTYNLDYIFLLALFHPSDLVTFGNSQIFGKIFEELNSLGSHGIVVANSVFSGIMKFHVCALAGDHLNEKLGFVNNLCCRMCNATEEQMKTLPVQDVSLLRSTREYWDKLKLNDVSKTGIKEKCVWLSLQRFDIFNNVATDIMKEWLEGCCHYTMTFIINHFVNDVHFFNVETLRNKLVAFDYGPDSGSNPSNCVSVNGISVVLKASASEMLSLVRYFGVIMGPYDTEENDVWFLYTILRKLTDRLFNFRVFPLGNNALTYDIQEFNELYLSLTGSTLEPCFHYLTHYPQMLRKFGPSSQIWYTRLEGRDRLSKLIATSSSSKDDICKAIAVKNQLIFNDLLLRDVPCPAYIFSDKRKADSLVVGEIASKFPTTNTKIEYYYVDWMTVEGNKIMESSVMTYDISEDGLYPLFCYVDEIVVSANNDVYFHVSCYETTFYDLNAFEVELSDTVTWIRLSDLINPYPSTLTFTKDHLTLVTLRRNVD